MPACRKTTDIYICFMLLVFPLFTGINGYAQITISKFLCFAIATGLWLLCLIAELLHYRVPLRGLTPLDAPDAAALLFLLLCTISAFASPWFPDSLLGAGRWDGLLTTALCILIFLGVRRFAAPKKLYLYALAGSLLVNFCIAVFQLCGFNPLRLFPGELSYYDAHIRYSGEFLGTIGNIDLLSAYLCLCVPLFLFAYVTKAAGRLFLIPAGLGMFLLMASGVAGGLFGVAVCLIISLPVIVHSRERLTRTLLSGAVLCFAAFAEKTLQFGVHSLAVAFSRMSVLLLSGTGICALAALFLHLRRQRRDISEKHYCRILAAILILLLLLAVLYLYVYEGESGTLYELSRILHGEIQDSFGSSRIRIWRNVLQLFKERPLLGGGTGTVANRLDILFSRYVPETGTTLKSYVDNAHNMYLAILSDTGIFGLCAFLALLVISIRHWIRRRHEASLFPALGCAALCYAAEEFFGLNLCLVSPLFWLIWGLFESEPDHAEMLQKDLESEQDEDDAAGEFGS